MYNYRNTPRLQQGDGIDVKPIYDVEPAAFEMPLPELPERLVALDVFQGGGRFATELRKFSAKSNHYE